MSYYEALILSSAQLSQEDQDALVERYAGIIGENGGTIQKTDPWGKRVLAYEINKETEGYYTLFEFDGTGSLVKELERRLKIDESILRHMVVNKDHDIRLQQKADAKKSRRSQKPAPEAQEQKEPEAESEEE